MFKLKYMLSGKNDLDKNKQINITEQGVPSNIGRDCQRKPKDNTKHWVVANVDTRLAVFIEEVKSRSLFYTFSLNQIAA